MHLGPHPNILFAMHVMEVGAKPHLVMEYADGGDLRAWIEGDGLSVPLSVNLAI